MKWLNLISLIYDAAAEVVNGPKKGGNIFYFFYYTCSVQPNSKYRSVFYMKEM